MPDWLDMSVLDVLAATPLKYVLGLLVLAWALDLIGDAVRERLTEQALRRKTSRRRGAVTDD